MPYQRAKITMNGKRMRTLYLLRHSGTLSTSATGRDIDRRLSPDGIRNAEAVAEHIAGSSPLPQVILTSPATRARETAAFVTAKIDVRETIIPEIYEASAASLVDVVRSITGSIDAALMVGHNPGFGAIVEFFTGSTVAMHSPSVAKIMFDIDDWENAERHAGRLADLYSPAVSIQLR